MNLALGMPLFHALMYNIINGVFFFFIKFFTDTGFDGRYDAVNILRARNSALCKCDRAWENIL